MLRYPVLFIKKEGGWAGSGHLAPVRSAQQIREGPLSTSWNNTPTSLSEIGVIICFSLFDWIGREGD
jgi:hypothetical protein